MNKSAEQLLYLIPINSEESESQGQISERCNVQPPHYLSNFSKVNCFHSNSRVSSLKKVTKSSFVRESFTCPDEIKPINLSNDSDPAPCEENKTAEDERDILNINLENYYTEIVKEGKPLINCNALQMLIQQICSKYTETKVFSEEQLSYSKTECMNTDYLTSEFLTPSASRAKEIRNNGLIDIVESQKACQTFKASSNKYLTNYYKCNRNNRENWNEIVSCRNTPKNLSLCNITEHECAQEKNEYLIPKVKDGEDYKKLSLEVNRFMTKAKKPNNFKINFCLFLELLESMGFITQQNSMSLGNTPQSLCNTEKKKYIEHKRNRSTLNQTFKLLKARKNSESLGRTYKNLKQTNKINNFKELKLCNEIWSRLHGRVNDYILVRNLKTFLVAIMCLWLPWMKARYNLETSQNPLMTYNFAKSILSKPENSIGIFDSNGIFYFHSRASANKIADMFTLFRAQRNRFLNKKVCSKTPQTKEISPKEMRSPKLDSEKKSCVSFRPGSLDSDYVKTESLNSIADENSYKYSAEEIALNTEDLKNNMQNTKRKLDFDHISKVSSFEFANDYKSSNLSNSIESKELRLENLKESDSLDDLFYQPLKQKQSKPPYLIIDVHINDCETISIPVYQGDKAEDLARKFSIEYQIPEEKELELKELIGEQIKNVLGRIDESENEDTTNNF